MLVVTSVINYNSLRTYSFAGASLSAGHDISASHYHRQSILLYWCWLGVANSGDVTLDLVTKVELLEGLDNLDLKEGFTFQ